MHVLYLTVDINVGLRRSDGRDIGTCLVPRVDQHRYRSRKGRLAQNVLAICDFDMNFTYVYAGWEGSAADARVLDNAVSQDPNFPFPRLGKILAGLRMTMPCDNAGKYYLVDAGFANYNVSWLLTEEQGITYLSGGDKVIDIEPHRTCSTMHIQGCEM
ncbi:UNVERIFIED_CONTAM: hypothetical protein Sradi_6476700 [Sesamum radiatum]|uniref:DDE Tnp4 domain-containing protein n=1 Tax=Sesamum radiatum TaxID=300843 RepID=A0AAW2K5U1_SESRA